jgi:hypothetical protein
MMSEEDQYAKYTNCRNALGVSLWDVIKQARSRKILETFIDEVFTHPISRDDAICQLRNIGMSLDDIGAVSGMTRERVRQIIKENGQTPGKSADYNRKSSVPVSDDFVIRLICHSTKYWSELTGVCLIQTLEKDLHNDGYTTDQIKLCFDRMRLHERSAKPRLLICYWFDVPEEKHREWLSSELRDISQAQLLDRLNHMSPVKVSIMAFNTYMRKLGIVANAGAQGVRRSYGKSDDDWSWMNR